MRFSKVIAFLAATVLTACGGGGGSSPPPDGPTPAPTPPPNPTPTPTPPPSVSYPTFPLTTSSVTLPSDYALIQTSITSSGTQFGRSAVFNDGEVSLTSNVGAEDIVAVIPGEATGFFRDYAPGTPTGPSAFEIVLRSLAGSGAIVLLNNFLPGQNTNNPNFQFRYLGYAKWARGGSFFTQFHQVFGFRTQDADLPTTARSYSAYLQGLSPTADLVSGSAMDSLTGTGTIVIDPATKTGTIDIDMTLRKFGQPGTPFGKFRGTGAFDANTGRIRGTLDPNEKIGQSEFTGSFYGPSGAELGLVFTFRNGSGVERRTTGFVIAK